MRRTQSDFIFVDGFSETNLSFALPVIEGYARERGIHEIVIYKTNLRSLDGFRQYSHDISLRNSVTRDSFLAGVESFKNISFTCRLIMFSIVCLVGMNRAYFSRSYYAGTDFRLGVMHAIYDSLSKRFPMQYATGKFSFSGKVSLLNRIVRMILVYLSVTHSRCKGVFLGHFVYHTRFCAIFALHFAKPLVVHGGYNFSQILDWNDPPPPILRPGTLRALQPSLCHSKIVCYIEQRSSGGGRNPDILELPSNGILSSGDGQLPMGYILCYVPVLADSPFGWLDRDRAFCDVLAWLIATRNFCLSQEIPLVLKLHPSRRVWGENTELLLSAAGIHNAEFCKIIRADIAPAMQEELISRARQVISFRGTVALETVSLGWSTIVISRNAASFSIPEAVLKPRTPNQYLHFLGQEKFAVSLKQRELANHIIYVQDNHISFAGLINAKPLYAGLSKEERGARAAEIIEGSSTHRRHFIQMGVALAKGDLQTIYEGSCKNF